MDVFQFSEFGKLKFIYHTTDTFLEFQCAPALSAENTNSAVTHLLEVMALMALLQTRTDNAPHMSPLRCSNSLHMVKHITAAPHNAAGQTVVEKA